MTNSATGKQSVEIRPLAASDEAAWKALWLSYAEESGETPTEAEIGRAWSNLMEPDIPLYGLTADAARCLAAFLLYAPIPYPWDSGSACYLVDISVARDFRRRGIARALIEALTDIGRRQGWRHIFWMAQRDNSGARRLYDEIAVESDLIRYDIPLMTSDTTSRS